MNGADTPGSGCALTHMDPSECKFDFTVCQVKFTMSPPPPSPLEHMLPMILQKPSMRPVDLLLRHWEPLVVAHALRRLSGPLACTGRMCAAWASARSPPLMILRPLIAQVLS